MKLHLQKIKRKRKARLSVSTFAVWGGLGGLGGSEASNMEEQERQEKGMRSLEAESVYCPEVKKYAPCIDWLQTRVSWEKQKRIMRN